MPTRLRRFRLSAIGSIYVLIPLIVIAATALAYYSYRSADQLARRGEESVIETTDELASIQMARVHRRRTSTIEWDTNSSVPVLRKLSIQSRHLRWKAASPTDSASSTTRISASTWAQIEKARRVRIPME